MIRYESVLANLEARFGSLGCQMRHVIAIVRGSSFMFTKETASEKQQAQEDLNDRNTDYLIQQQIIKEHFLAEQAKKSKSRRLKRVPKPDETLLKRNKNSKGRDRLIPVPDIRALAIIDSIYSRGDS